MLWQPIRRYPYCCFFCRGIKAAVEEKGLKIDLDGESDRQVVRISRSDPNEGRVGAPVVAVTFAVDRLSEKKKHR